MESEFPGNNSHTKKQAAKKTVVKKVERVVSGEVSRSKQPIMKRLKEHFFPTRDVPLPEHILFEVLLPAARTAAAEVLHQSIDVSLPYEGRRGGGRRGGGRGYTAYSRPGTPPWARDEERRDSGVSRRTRATHSFDQVIIYDRGEAQIVLDEMYNLLDQYDAVTVGDFYDCVGESKDFTDENYGWTSLDGTRIIRRSGGYVIDLPPTEQLNRAR